MGRRYEAIVSIEICRQVNDCQSKSPRAHLCWRYQRHPVVDEGIHNHIEDGEGQGVALHHALVPIEQASEISAGPGHHGQSIPLR